MQSFWETKKLEEMSEEEWEAVCDGCAKCCYHSFLLEGMESEPIQLPCSLLNEESRRCINYKKREERVPECIVLSVDRPESFAWMPETCAYRLLHEGKPLPDHHPLITGRSPFFQTQTPPVAAPRVYVEQKPSTPIPKKPAALPNRRSCTTVGQSDQQEAWIADLSVEIRTALNSIMGVTQLLGSTTLTAEQQSHIETILLSSAGLLKKIDPAFEMPKYGSRLLDSRESPIHLGGICDVLFKRFRATAEKRGIDFKCECRSGVPYYVVGNEGWLEQVLSNLLKNAFRGISEGMVHLSIEALGRGTDGVELCFKVMDTGEGIDDAKKEDIFHSFDESGLGLVICQKLVGFMGGSLEVESIPGKGTTFQFALTLTQPSHAPSFGKKKETPVESETVVKSNVRVLLVEDNKVNQKVMLSMLRKAGCQVDVAGDGKAAVSQFREHAYDIVLMDCQMPLVDGYEATYRIRALDEPICRVPIIAVTAHAMEGDQKKCLQSGMTDYLSKPINNRKLIDMINKYTS